MENERSINVGMIQQKNRLTSDTRQLSSKLTTNYYKYNSLFEWTYKATDSLTGSSRVGDSLEYYRKQNRWRHKAHLLQRSKGWSKNGPSGRQQSKRCHSTLLPAILPNVTWWPIFRTLSTSDTAKVKIPPHLKCVTTLPCEILGIFLTGRTARFFAPSSGKNLRQHAL